MTIDDVKEAHDLIAKRQALLIEASAVERLGADATHIFGVQFDLDMEDVLRMAMVREFRRRATSYDVRLRAIGLTIPAEPVEADATSQPIWPNGCIKPGACSRHAQCMYAPSKKQCVHFGQDLTAEIAKAEAA